MSGLSVKTYTPTFHVKTDWMAKQDEQGCCDPPEAIASARELWKIDVTFMQRRQRPSKEWDRKNVPKT